MKRRLSLVLLLACVACNAIPADPEGTLARVRAERQFRVGLVAPATADVRVARYLRRVGTAAAAAPHVEPGSAEPLLLRLEEGEIDLVVGTMDRASPWSTRVFMLPPLARDRRGSAELDLVPMARNGENRWIALLDGAARAEAGE